MLKALHLRRFFYCEKSGINAATPNYQQKENLKQCNG